MPVYIESNHQSPKGSDPVAFRLEEGLSRVLCSSDRTSGNRAEYTMEEICSTLDNGYVSLYRFKESGEKHLVKQWRYDEQNKGVPLDWSI